MRHSRGRIALPRIPRRRISAKRRSPPANCSTQLRREPSRNCGAAVPSLSCGSHSGGRRTSPAAAPARRRRVRRARDPGHRAVVGVAVAAAGRGGANTGHHGHVVVAARGVVDAVAPAARRATLQPSQLSQQARLVQKVEAAPVISGSRSR
jgi:hypothetical protein